MNDYQLFYKHRLDAAATWTGRWDVFISAYNSSERVRLVAEKVRADEKHWLLLPEYDYEVGDYPRTGTVYSNPGASEAEFLAGFLATLGKDRLDRRMLIDITGFVGHYVLVLLALLQRSGLRSCDVLYAEPLRYARSERTKFSDEAVLDVRQVAGFEGTHVPETANDLLVLGVGYDSRLVAEIANNKEHAEKRQVFCLPSLRPDMYQESLLCAAKVQEAVGPYASRPQHFHYAPANDPFVTAEVVSSLVREHRDAHPGANVYLAPLSTKAQALGFAIFYLHECVNTATSVIYPFCKQYMRATSEGLSGALLYEVELDWLGVRQPPRAPA